MACAYVAPMPETDTGIVETALLPNMTNPQPVTSHVAEHPHNLSETKAPSAPVIPAPSAPYAAIPPTPVPARPAPAGTGVQTKIADPFRTHTRNNPQVTNVVPKLKTIQR